MHLQKIPRGYTPELKLVKAMFGNHVFIPEDPTHQDILFSKIDGLIIHELMSVRERAIIRCTYGLDKRHTEQGLCKFFRIPRQRYKELEAQALKKLRSCPKKWKQFAGLVLSTN